MSFNINSLINAVNREGDRRLLYGSPSYNKCAIGKSCPVALRNKTTFCSLDAFFRACTGVGKRTKTVGHIETKNRIARPEFCKKCKQLRASEKGKLVIDLAEYGIEIDEELMKLYEGKG